MPKVDELPITLAELMNNIHLFPLSETWLDSQILDSEIDISGYRVFRQDRNRNGGGVAVYARDDLNVVRRLDLEMSGVDAIWVEIFLPKPRGFPLGTFYRPPNSSDHYNKEFITKVESILELASLNSTEVILMVDFNCDFLAKRTYHQECKHLKSLFKTFNFTQFIDQPTRVSATSSTCLDLIATNPLARCEAPTAGQRPAGEGANIDRRLVPYTRDEMRTKSRIEFIYLYTYIYASTVVLMRAALEFWPW